MGGRAPNDLNNGVEALVACLASERRGGKLLATDEERYSNVDDDGVSGNVTGWFFGDNKLRELTDNFGNVILYLHHRDFAKPRPFTLVQSSYSKRRLDTNVCSHSPSGGRRSSASSCATMTEVST